MATAGGRVASADINNALAGSSLRPVCILTRTSASPSIANNGQAISWDTEDLDTHGWHSTGTNPSRITPQTAGWIEFQATAHFTSNVTGRRGIGIRKNGGTIYYGQISIAGTGNLGVTVAVTLSANGTTDYFEAWAFQDSGGALNLVDFNSTRFEAKWDRSS